MSISTMRACACGLRWSRAGGQPDGVEDLRVAGAAAEVAGQCLADLVVARARIARQQIRGRDDQARSAEAALDRAGLGEGLLDGVQPAVLAQTFDGHQLVPVRLGGKDEACADELAVQQHGARSALALLARVLRARQTEPLAENVEQTLARPHVGLMALAVDGQLDSHCRQRSRARSVRTRSEWRR